MNKIGTVFLTSLLIFTTQHTSRAKAVDADSVRGTRIADAVSLTFATQQATLVPVTATLAALNLQQPVLPTQPKTLKEIAEEMVTAQFGPGEFAAFDKIIARESSWNPSAVNRSSGACGLPQALPCSKIGDRSPEGQLRWAIQYIASRYGTPKLAWNFWQRHHWY